MTLDQLYQNALRHHAAGELARAQTLYRQILASQPNHADSLHRLGLLAQQTGHLPAAIELIGRAAKLRPNLAIYHRDLGGALLAAGRPAEAIAALGQALTLEPFSPETCMALGSAHYAAGQIDEAIEMLRRTANLAPRAVEPRANLGFLLEQKGRYDEAIAVLREAIALQPDSPEVLNNLGLALRGGGRLDEALATLRRSLELKPDFFPALVNLGAALQDTGDVRGVQDCFRRAMARRPHPGIAGSLLYAMYFDEASDPAQILQEHARWNDTYARPLLPRPIEHANLPTANRRLRIGYVSPDLSDHPVGRFLVPLLENHDHSNFEIFCYSDTLRPDAVTEKLRSCCDAWRSTAGRGDDEVAGTIRLDGIDILVDLNMHTRDNRLLVFARKPAPVQVTYLAYAGTTGLEAMDYRLTDAHLDPPGSGDEFYSETSIRLPNTFWCYQPVPSAPQVAQLPALRAGHITFGCLNSFWKMSDSALRAWSGILRETPGSRLILTSQPGRHRTATLDRFQHEGVSPERVEFAGRSSMSSYLDRYGQIDIALDPFPYPGGTTSCDALWMGVPVVSLVGKTAVSRGGLSILSNVGLPDLAARDTAQYIQIAAGLAKDLPRLASLRSTMRARMLWSPLMDAPGFARDIEHAFRSMWREWCGK